MDEVAKKIFSKLQDEESRELFSCRYNYFKDGNYEHLWDELSIRNKYKYKSIESTMYKKDANYKIINGFFSKDGCVLFGAGANLRISLKLFQRKSIKIHCICDSDVAKQGKLLAEHTIISPEQMLSEYSELPIIITPHLENIQKEIYNYLISRGVSDDIIFFLDYEREKQYFGVPFICKQPNEIYIDAGCFDGETILDFNAFTEGTYSKIYGFEPDRECFAKTRKTIEKAGIENVVMVQKGLWNASTTLHFDRTKIDMAGCKISEDGADSIETISIDEAVCSYDKITFIKMDIEGAEREAIEGGANTIRSCMPRLAICIYHKPDDVLAIPEAILSISINYIFYIRHHAPWVGNETVLYAIPEKNI